MKITSHFSQSEFESHDGARMPPDVLVNIYALCYQLEIIRKAFPGSKIIINSGYRSPAHNTEVGGRPQSMHLLGKAADIVVPGVTSPVLYAKIISLISQNLLIQGGVGYYATFVHYDIRGYAARWIG